jgi:ankyrin repeat protein
MIAALGVLPMLLAFRPLDEQLLLATGAGDRPKVEAHLADGADVNATRSDGKAALHEAAQQGHREIVRSSPYS